MFLSDIILLVCTLQVVKFDLRDKWLLLTRFHYYISLFPPLKKRKKVIATRILTFFSQLHNLQFWLFFLKIVRILKYELQDSAFAVLSFFSELHDINFIVRKK